MQENEKRVVKIVQELLIDDAQHLQITPRLISEKIDIVVSMNNKWGVNLNREYVIKELIQRFSLWIGGDKTIKNNHGHIAWLNAAKKTDWRYWQRYQEYLEQKLSYTVVDALDNSTDSILELLEDPLRSGSWDRRGLVVGHVQSGKTASYTGLICKAADAGYKIIIVLAGMHNNLRSQTQIRLDEGFLGYATNNDPELIEYVGVGKDGLDANIKPNCATNRSETGDFNTKVARHLAISPEQRPWLFVIKKNKTVLVRILEWIRNHAADSHDPKTGRKIVTNLPLLVIDDEADHASVDTGEQLLDENGKLDENYQPKAINSNIRKILHSFSKSAYVGYTATPFANIFIHERGETLEEGPDLFPSSFIKSLAAPSNYIGPAKVFGLLGEQGREGGLPLVRIIKEVKDPEEDWMPKGHKNGHQPLYRGMQILPPSLVEAIDAFLLACAVRHLRGQALEHSSMLVHVTRFNSVQNEVHEQIEEHVKNIKQRIIRKIDHHKIIDRLKNLWQKDFLPTTKSIQIAEPDQLTNIDINWLDIEEILSVAISDIQVRAINGKAKEALDYSEHENTGLKIIAVGGDKLSRGLTLEGLTVSYFLRASKMYDTLMQMGRWFGYRQGYLDVSRIYTTSELSEWFGDITDAAEELREEFDLMVESNLSPREYGLKVQSHSVLMVTSKLKMRSAKTLMLSFSGQVLETISHFKDSKHLNQNLELTKNFISKLNNPEVNPTKTRAGSRQIWTGSYLWSNVKANEVIDFFSNYQTHPEAHKVVSKCLAEFVQQMNSVGELTNWTIAFIGSDGSGEGDSFSLSDDVKVNMLKRQNKGNYEDRYAIGRLLSPRDEGIDLSESEWLAALELTRKSWQEDPARFHERAEPKIPSGPAIRQIRGYGADNGESHRDRGVLLIYLLDPREAWTTLPKNSPPVVAFGVSFPGSNAGVKVKYVVNNVLWEQEYGPAE
jgi:hypothetical protein